MKKIQKLFMAVAAVAGVTACTTDVTEDLGVNLNGGPTTLTLSLDDTRTQLGTQDASGVYALTWAENDAISVNGSVSNALAADEAGATTATFNFEKGFGSAPYFVAYPATSTNNQVVFAAEQTHKDNTTFGNNAAVMYGYATDLNSIKLNHLTGVLKIGVVSDNYETLKAVRISTVDRKPIAGAFNATYNTETEKVEFAAAEDATEVITYSLGDGVALTADATYIHVAVPVGEYGELFVTLEAESEKEEVIGVVTKTTAYSYKTIPGTGVINAGAVREYTNNLKFEPADETTDYVIATYDDLKKFKTAVEGGDTRNAILVNDIEVGDDWVSIDAAAYAATFNGNGYAIKGLNAPLFTNLGANVKGLHLKDVNINATTATTSNFGTLANSYYGSSVSNCSTEGSVSITITNDATKFVGGFFGQTLKAVTLSNLVNGVDITTDGELEQLSLGGIAGSTGSSGNAVATTATNLTNKGDLKVNDTKWDCSDIKTNNNFGGLFGYSYGTINASDLTNEGSISIVNTAKPTTAENGKINLGGILGLNGKVVTAENWHNKGDILLQNKNIKGSYLNIGGITSYNQIENSSYTNLTNDGNITVSNVTIDTTSDSGFMDVGGIFGTATKLTKLYGNITNTGDIVCYNITKTSSHNPGFGGIIGRSNAKVELDDNIVLNNSGDVKVLGGYYTGSFGIAGIVGCNTNGTIGVKNATNTGNIISATTLKSNKTAFVGGITGGTWASNISNSKSYCNVAAFTWDGKADSAPTKDTKAKVGILVSFEYDATYFSNCQIGGGWYKSATVVTNEDGELELNITYDDVTASNFFSYISGTSNPTSAPGDSVCKYWDGK